MRRLLFIFFVLTLVPSVFSQRAARHKNEPSAEQKQQFADDQQAINELHDKDIQASLALDADAIQALWTDDIVTIAPGGPPSVGREANRAALDKRVQEMKSLEILSYNEQFQEVQVVGDWAFEWGTITTRTHPFKGGKETQLVFNVMRILKRQPDQTWRIARSIYNDATPAPVAPPPEQPKKQEDDRNRLND